MKDFLFRLTIFIFIVSAFAASPIHAKAEGNTLVINELMPNPVGTDTGKEWIEIYNNSDAKINLQGWQIKDKTSSYTIGDLSIEPKSFLVIFPTVSLNNTDEIITLTNGIETDTLSYSSSTEGISLERINPDCSDFKAHSRADTKGNINENFIVNYCKNETKINILTRKSGITDWNEDHTYLLNDTIEAKFEISPDKPISKVKWIYKDKEFFDEEPKILLSDFTSSTLTLELKIENEIFIGSIDLKINPIIKLNEIFVDPEGADAGKEWVELFNPNSFKINLKEWKLKIGTKSQVFEEIIIFPKQFLTINTNYSLTNTGTEISLISPHGLITDSFKYNLSEQNISWARSTDGEGDWILIPPTKGSTNVTGILSENTTAAAKEIQSQYNLEKVMSFQPDLVFPKIFAKPKAEENAADPLIISFIHANKYAFGIFLLLEAIIYLFLVLDKEERKLILQKIKSQLKSE